MPDGQWAEVAVSPLGWTEVSSASAAAAPTDGLAASASEIENELLRVRFSPDGTLASVYDKAAEREVCLPCAAVPLPVFPLRSLSDSWAIFYDRLGAVCIGRTRHGTKHGQLCLPVYQFAKDCGSTACVSF